MRSLECCLLLWHLDSIARSVDAPHPSVSIGLALRTSRMDLSLNLMVMDALLDDDDDELEILAAIPEAGASWLRSLLSISPERPVAAAGRINFDALSNEDSVLYFRFSKEELLTLCHELRLPDTIRTDHGYRCTGLEALLVLCRRLAFPCRLKELETFFGMSSSAISAIFHWALQHLAEKFASILTLDSHRLNAAKLAEYAAAIQGAGGLGNCWGFIDGTLREICRPTRFQRAAFSGHKRCHGLKFQAIATPDGLISHVFGPIEGRHHDVYVLSASQLLQRFEDNPLFDGYVVFGDQGYCVSRYLSSPWKGASLNADQQDFNRRMSGLRISVEWQFAWVIQHWRFLDLRCEMKVWGTPVARLYIVGVLLSNCLTCLRGRNQTSEHFNIDPPSLHEYLHADEL